jgi:hypothetical protein
VERSHSVGQPAPEASAHSPGQEEHGHAGGHLLHADVQIAFDLKRERAYEEAG